MGMSAEFRSAEDFVGAVTETIIQIASHSWEQWTVESVRMSDAGTELLIRVKHPRVTDGTVIEYPVEAPFDTEQVAFCVMWIEPLLDSVDDPMSNAHGSPPRLTF